MARIRTLNFLPEIFQTQINTEFLSATLDQLVNPPVTSKIQGYVGSKLGPGINAKNSYVPEPTKARIDYQLEPGIVFEKPNTNTARDFITYPGMLDSLKLQYGITDNNSKLFTGDFYSWDSFCDLDSFVNYNQYYWLPDGPPAVTVAPSTVYNNVEYVVTYTNSGYSIKVLGTNAGTINPTLTLLRGGSYNFYVSQDSQFFIQGEPGVSGYSPVQPNLYTRDVYGVSNNGAASGIVTFNVPQADAQSEYDFANTTNVDVVSTKSFAEVNGQLLSTVGDIDGITELDGLRVLFYNTGVLNETGYVSSYFDEVPFDNNNPTFDPYITTTTLNIQSTSSTGNKITLASGTTSGMYVNQTIVFNAPTYGNIEAGQVYFVNNILNSTQFTVTVNIGGNDTVLTNSSTPMTAILGEGLYEEGFYTTVNDNFYRVTYVGTGPDYVIRLIPDGTIPSDEKLVPTLGTEYNNLGFFKNDLGYIQLIPYISAPLSTLYYQDSENPDNVGILRIIENNQINTINVVTDILGKKKYTSNNGVVFTNGLKVKFSGDVIPTSYLEGEYYVEGVGSAIELIPVSDLVCPEKFSQGIYNPYDILPYDIGNYEINLYVPVLQDYITIARNALNRNAWSRSNRWFHIDVINATATYNNNPEIKNLANNDTKAKRPIIQFYPNLRMFDSGVTSKKPIDFIDTRNTDALSTVPNSLVYYPDIQVYTTNTATISAAVATTSTTVVVPVTSLTGAVEPYMYISDSDNILPHNSVITSITNDGTNYTFNVEWENAQSFSLTTNVALFASETTTSNYSLFEGARVIFANDDNVNVRNKIYVAEYSVVTTGSSPVLTLTLAEDGNIDIDTQVIIYRGYYNQGKSFYFDGVNYDYAQQKTTVNQAPLFDIFDKNGISLSDNTVYNGTDFAGTKLFGYKIGTGSADPVLGFSVGYTSSNTVGDINFVVYLNDDKFTYIVDGNPVNENINVGYVYNYTADDGNVKQLGYQNTVAPSAQYQVYEFEYDVSNPVTQLECDIAALPDLSGDEKGWPRIKLYYNNVYQSGGHKSGLVNDVDYTYTISANKTTINLINSPTESTVIQVLVLSDQVSKIAYYQVPINLTNNPTNLYLTGINFSDVRYHYTSIFDNSPDTTGPALGPNNYRDCGNIVPYGTQLIQNSSSLVLPGMFLRTPYHNLFDALLYNSREYVKYKQLIVYTVANTSFDQTFRPSNILDNVLDQITASKSEINSFFWSDMLPNKSPFISNTYVFNNGLDNTYFPLSKVYDFSQANYDGVLVYLIRGNYEYQLLRGIDYVISTDSPSLNVTTDLLPNDLIVINEYNQTYGSYVPYTPTKLGLYPAFEPAVVLDSDYSTPTYFIRGHDGSYNKLYGSYDSVNDVLIDFRDQALLEFEQRIYNNIKLSTSVPIRDYEILPGYFRQSSATYSYDQFLAMYTPNFLDWVGQNRLDYKTQYYTNNNEYTYNYRNSGNKLDNKPIQQGYWRGVYEYFFDTFTPNLTPWEMLGFSIMPDWWTSRYGPAPYTSGNQILWNDVRDGYIYNDGMGYYVPELARPDIYDILPVDSAGNLVSPFKAIVGNYVRNTFQSDWKVGDIGPVELSYRRSSSWPFDLVRLFALTRPAEFYNLAVDLDNYKYNEEFNQYLVNDRSYLKVDDIQVYGNGIAKTSYINWIVDYEKQQGIDATNNVKEMLDNTDVRLVYRLAGYSDQNLLNFYVEKANQTSTNSTLLIPQESYSILLYENQPIDKIVLSSVIVQKNQGYFTVYGNSQNYAYFEIADPVYDGRFNTLSVYRLSAKVAKNYSKNKTLVPYGAKFYNVQDLSQFLMSYGANLAQKGVLSESTVNGVPVTWQQMVQEFLYWSQQGWQNGSIINLNPNAQDLDINPLDKVVQPLTLHQQNFLLNQNLYPLAFKDICVTRDGTNFHVHTLNSGDSISYGQFNLSNFEHGIVFDNVTQFNDVIYSLVTGLKQNRIYVRGVKSAEWNGTVDASGFILSQHTITDYDNTVKYTKGSVVKYKNRYYAALTVVQPSLAFDETKWKLINYKNIQFGMLANPSTRAYESTLYYNSYKANLQNDADLLSYSLVGYRPRDYLADIELTSTAQVEIYKNLIKNKGTNNSIQAFGGVNLPQGGIQYDAHENWAIQTNTYGGVNNQNFVEFRVNQTLMTGDPSIVSLSNYDTTVGSMEEVNIRNLFNYGTAITTNNILKTTKESSHTIYPSAGYINYNDVKMAAYYYSQLPSAVDSNNKIIPIQNFYVGDYLWLANFKQKWNVYRWNTIGQIIQVRGNNNQTAIVTFAKPHNLKKNEPLAIINFATNVDGYYLVNEVVNLNQVIINLALVGQSNVNLQGNGLGFGFESQRVLTPSLIGTLDLVENDFVKNTAWVDENTDGGWAVYRKSINYQNIGELDIPIAHELGNYGSSVAYTTTSGYLAGDAMAGTVYRYTYSKASGFILLQQLAGSSSFGSAIAYANNVYAISQPTASPRVKLYVINDTTVTNDMIAIQTITALDGSTNWGSSIAFSNDGNFLYISAVDLDSVYVYQKQNIALTAGYFVPGQTYVITSLGTTDFTAIGAVDNLVGITFTATGSGTGTGTATQVTYSHVNTITGTVSTSFGSSIATNNAGDKLIIGAPGVDISLTIQNNGKAYAYARATQNYEVQYNSVTYQPIEFALVWTPDNLASKTGTTVNSSDITLNNTTSLAVDMPVMFVGTNNNYSDFQDSGISPYVVYYIHSIVGSTIKIKSSRTASTYISLTNATGLSFSMYPQDNSMFVSVNGTVVQDNNYAVANNNFYYLSSVMAGDIINVSDNRFFLQQELTSNYSDRTDIQYGTAVASNKYGSNIVVGSPFEIDANNIEGAAYSYIDAGMKYGVVTGQNECNVTSTRNVLLNGFKATLNPGNAASIAEQINSYNIINLQAGSTADNKLIIQLADNNLGLVEQKLTVTAFSNDVLSELGILPYTNTQIIQSPRGSGPTQFGTRLKINENNNILVSAPVATRYEGTFFDFSDDENLVNDTIFDNNATTFVESYMNAGAVYMYEYLANYQESLENPGQYVYAQGVNDTSTDYGYNTGYGLSIEFHQNVVMVGSPSYQSTTVGGKVLAFNNDSGLNDWTVYRQSASVVDINSIQNTQLFSASTNDTLINLDYFDPLQGKLLGAVRENIDFVAGADPANYNLNNSQQSGLVWGAAQTGMIWFDTSNVRWMNYHQNDVVYNSRRWGAVFPGSDVAVYTWISSYVLPVNYQGPGTPYDTNQYVVGSTLNSTGIIVPVYYYWVRNTNTIVNQYKKTLSDTTIASYIANPKNSGISYMAPLLPNTFALYNVTGYFNGTDTVFHVGYSTGDGIDVIHNEYKLIRENYAEDFLPGLPVATDNTYTEPTSLYAKLLDSLSGCDIEGQVLPNPFLPPAVQQGIQNFPRQSFFYDRYKALENYVQFMNEFYISHPIVEIANLTYLFEVGPINPSNGKPFYDVTNFWEYTNYWVPGYNNSTKPVAQVAQYANLAELNLASGSIVKVLSNENGHSEYYINNNLQVWERIGVENGTIQIKPSIYDYTINRYGFGDNYYDASPYDEYPSTETRYIVRAFNEQLPGEFDIVRNKGLILLFKYIQSETIESQNYLPWLNKTSLVDVTHNLRELLPYTNYVSDNTAFLTEYLQEVKPYHVVLKDFLYKYSATDTYINNITDFDVPAIYDATNLKYVSPEMTYNTYPDNIYQYPYDADIWQTGPYAEWYSNYGLTFGTPTYDNGVLTGYYGLNNYNIARLESYMNLNSKSMVVDNCNGWPTNGIIQIDDEQIAYNQIDPLTNTVSGLYRGYNNTPVKIHLPQTPVYINLPAIVVLNGSRGYINPPVITAKIDTSIYPAPRVEALFQAVMSLDSVAEIQVVNPGIGYKVLPEIDIEPSLTVTFANTDIVSAFNTLVLYAPELQTGDMVRYKNGTGAGVGGLVNDEWYYISILESSPNTIVALYRTYLDAVNDNDRVDIEDIGVSTGMSLNLGARAVAITDSTPTREVKVKIKFDRTSYQSQIKDWTQNAFYGSFYAGNYHNADALSSSDLALYSSNPNINNVLASDHSVVFEIVNVDNEQEYVYSSFLRYVKQTIAATNGIRLIPLDGNNPNLSELEPNASGTTVGMYTNMPIKFNGEVIGNLVQGQTYYVKDILSETDFTVSETIDGSTFVLTDQTVATTLECVTGYIKELTVLTVNYPDIFIVTNTAVTTNAVTVPLSYIGTGGTTGFYPGMLLYFTDNNPGETIFGNIVANQVYYVNTIIDEENFTLSAVDVNVETNVYDEPFTTQQATVIYSTTATATNSVGNVVTVDSTSDFATNDPVIFNNMVVSGVSVSSFGNIVNGSLYYVSSVLSPTTMTISENINGSVFVLTSTSGSMTATNQKNTVQLTTASGTMTLIAGLPVSPGQVDGQRFTVYPTSGQYTNIGSGNYAISNLLSRKIEASISTVNRLVIDDTSNFYTNMPFQLGTAIGGLSASTTYYVRDYTGKEVSPGTYLGVISVVCDSTNSTGNKIHTATGSDTTTLYVNMPIVFSGNGLGNIVIGTRYYVKTIVDSTNFTISATPGGSTFVLLTDNGAMTASGGPYITVSTVPNGSEVSLTTSSPIIPIDFTQTILSYPVFDVSYLLGGYYVLIQTAGSGFAPSNTIQINGNLIGGSNPVNNLTVTVVSVGTSGEITNVTASGTPAGTNTDYYFKIRGSNKFEVYTDPLLKIPASASMFPYYGFTTTTATSVTASNNRITVGDTSGFTENDPVIFTGTMFSSEIVLGQTYYVKSIVSSTQLTISETVNGTTLDILSNQSGSMTMAKVGSYAFLSEPFYFEPSIIRFNGRLYRCIVSNNDSEFVIGKWELIDSSDYRINAMDRAVGYYQPTPNMPGRDLTQLFTGLTYPNTTYMGNDFEPDKQFPLDTIIKDQPFYPATVDLSGVAYNNGYITSANTNDNSLVLTSSNGDSWNIKTLTPNDVDFTDIIYSNGLYMMTSTSTVTPIYVSLDKVTWSASTTNTAGLSLNAVTYHNGGYVAAGNSIARSTNGFNWTTVRTFPANRNYMLFDIKSVTASSFNGVLAVGQAAKIVFVDNVYQQLDIDLICYSTDGIVFTQIDPVTSNALYAIASDNSKIIVGGQNGVLYTTNNGADFYGINEGSLISFNSINNIIETSNMSLTLNQEIYFNKTFSSIVAGTSYYVKSIISSALFTISDTPGGSTKVLSADALPEDTMVYGISYDDNDILSMAYGNGIFMTVGANGVIKTSNDGYAWTTQVSNTTEQLNKVIFVSADNSFIVVGNNNTIIETLDNGVTWTNISNFNTAPAEDTIKGADFNYGYGPEELVPGIVKDNLAMTVTTRTGTTWPIPQYGGSGYKTVSLEIEPSTSTQTDYYFGAATQYPTAVFVQVLDASMLGQTLYDTIDYTVDWKNKVVVLDTPLTISPLQKLRIDVYEIGNGNQLVRSNTDIDAIRNNDETGFDEIYVDCNFSASLSQGSGIVKPNTYESSIPATETIAGSNRIVVDTVDPLQIGSAITFSGTTFGGILTGTTYYVKSISTATSTITVSLTYNVGTGVVGPEVALTNATGTMNLNLSVGSQETYTGQLVYNNGTKLIQGNSSLITATSSVNNRITTNSTAGMIANSKITFSSSVFGGISPLTTYYIKQVVDATHFTISTTPGGAEFTLTTATGGATYITNDYAFGIQPNGMLAKIVFATDTYSNENNYISYALLGETTPAQVGYTVPETQLFVGDGTNNVFTLDNYVGQANPENSVVEINGLRVMPTDYTIDFGAGTITFTSVPGAGDNISVMSYNTTDQEYFRTQVSTTTDVYSVNIIDNNIQAPTCFTSATATTTGTNLITVSSTTNITVGQRVVFSGTGFGGVATDGTVYYINSVDTINSKIQIKDYNNNVISLTTATGLMAVTVGGLPSVLVQTTTNNGYTTNTIVNIDGVQGSTQLNGNTYYVRAVTPDSFELYLEPYDPALNATNYPVTTVSSYVNGGYVWTINSNVLFDASVQKTLLGNYIIVNDTSSLVANTPVYFNEENTLAGEATSIPEITQGTKYYLKDVAPVFAAGLFRIGEQYEIVSVGTTDFTLIGAANNNLGTVFIATGVGSGSGTAAAIQMITVSETYNGSVKTVSVVGSITTLKVTQWEQTNVDRLWVTVNGYRIPSSQLTISENNQLGILTPITTGDEVVITNMIPTSTPDKLVYLNNVDTVASVYRFTADNTTYLKEDIDPLSTEISLYDVTKVIDIVEQTSLAPAAVNNVFTVGLNVNKNNILDVTVYNNTKSLLISDQNYTLSFVNIAPVLLITDGAYIDQNDELFITTKSGKSIYVNGEIIAFSGVDVVNNKLTGITRGTEGTPELSFIDKYTNVYGLQDSDRLPDQYYDQIWNSYNYNTVEGDPLQVSNTSPANFLNMGIY